MKKFKILHTATHTTNIGDGALNFGIQNMLKKQNNNFDFTDDCLMDYENFYGDKKYSEKLVKKINNFDLLIIGGGGMIEGGRNLSNIGLAYNMPLNLLKRINKMTSERRKIFKYITQKLSKNKELKFQNFEIESSHSHHLLPCKCVSEKWDRNDLIKILYNKFKIKCVIQYHPLHRYDLFKKFGYGFADVPNTNEFYDSMISFPFSLTLSKEQIDYLIKSINSSINILNQK